MKIEYFYYAVVMITLTCLGSNETSAIVYQGSFPTDQIWSDTFQYAPPSDGRFILTIDNPDASDDGSIAILDGTAWNTGQNLIFFPVIRQGVQQSIFEVDVKQAWGLRPWLWLKDPSPNVGFDTLTLDFAPGSVGDQPKTYLGTLTSTAFETNSDSWTFDLDSPGKLLFNVTQWGGGGGAHKVYLDSMRIMELLVGWGDPGATAPDWSSVEVPAGHHTVLLAHEDDHWPDNYGVRQTSVYLVPPSECSDGLDNDSDGFVDYPDDPGCASPAATTESPACNDRVDNDGDGAIDFPADDGCVSDAARSEIRVDLDFNGVVDEGDRAAFAAAFGYAEGDPAYLPEGDFDGDGRITIVDYQRWLALYEQSLAARPRSTGCGLTGIELLGAVFAAWVIRRRRP